MQLHKCMLLSVLLMISNGFIVKGPSDPLVVPLGGSAVLPCSVDKPLPADTLKVVWIRTDSNTLVHVFQSGESVSEAQYKDFHNRADFFSENIQHGNYSLLLSNVRVEDKGFYRCKVYSDVDSEEALVEIKAVERLIVTRSAHNMSAFAGEDVTLNCSVDSHIPPEDIEVSWKKTDGDVDVFVLTYRNNEILSESSDKRYRGRVELYTDEIHRGNFSLRLKSIRTEDKGVYMCQVFAGRLSANITVELQQLGFSVIHIFVLFLCISACGSSVVLSALWCTSQNTRIALFLQISVVSAPNLIMFFAFLFWGVTEGFPSETVVCCAHFGLRILLLLWASPHTERFPGKRKTALHCSIHLEYALFTNIIFSVLFLSFRKKSLNYSEYDRVLITILFGIMILICIINIIFLLAEIIINEDGHVRAMLDFVSDIGHDALPPLQLIFLYYAFGAASQALFYIGVFPLFLTLTRYNWKDACLINMNYLRSSRRAAWFGFMIVVTFIMVYSYLIALVKEKDCVAWTCVAAFLQILWGIVVLKHSFGDLDLPFRRNVCLIGSVGVVSVDSIALMAELIQKKITGERAVGDLRLVVFPCECVFACFVLVLIIFEPYLKNLQRCPQNDTSSVSANELNQNVSNEEMCQVLPNGPEQNTNNESLEMRSLLQTQNNTT
ncbi:hypothetical protein E1301_Tti016257 [Triplophysa tibetana]|uniref:Ig-like domain-containing protein n=1 Tax=Triplophysa tibetana TaxID=1572043 RepID=A0A5A9NAB3_9TELE|nr:hypothetical protein E1301_Tti016257 [Triplophysa tibetana]